MKKGIKAIRTNHRFENGVELKRCGHCKEWRGLEKFWKNRKHWDGLCNRCAECRAIVRYRGQVQLCVCGCGKTAKPGKKFIHGHNQKGLTGKKCPMYGKKLALETRKKISEAGKGKNNPRFGKKHTAIARKKIAEANRRRECTTETRKKLSEAKKGKNYGMIGEKSSRWQGGLSSLPYCPVWGLIEFREVKKYLINVRDVGKCQNPYCRNISNRLVLHHINYDKKDCDLWNLITLCISCNSRANSKREYWQALYEEIIKNYGKTILNSASPETKNDRQRQVA